MYAIFVSLRRIVLMVALEWECREFERGHRPRGLSIVRQGRAVNGIDEEI